MTSPLPALGRSEATAGPLAGRLRLRLFGLAGETARPEERGFAVDDAAVAERLTRIGEIFLDAYRATLLDPRPKRWLPIVEAVPVGWRGFAWEGVGFALAVVDTLSPRRRRPGRLEEAIAGPGAAHRYLLIVGSGWALARLPKRIDSHLRRLDPRLAWLAFDGWGFHHGYFDRRAVDGHRLPRRLARRARWGFDVGLGRSLWFLEGADVARVAAVVEGFPLPRRGDLWAGIGIASAYAGGVDRAGLERLVGLAGPWAADLAQGVTFAAKARTAGSDPAPQTDLACAVVWGREAEATAAITDRVLAELGELAERPGDGSPRRLLHGDATAVGEPAAGPFFESWRRGIRAAWGAPRPAGG